MVFGAASRTVAERAEPILAQAGQGMLFLLVASIPLQAVLVLPWPHVTLTRLSGASLVLLEAIRRAVARQPLLPRTGLEGSLAIFAGACLLSVSGANEPRAALGSLATLAAYLLVFYAVAGASAEVQKRLVVIYVVSACAAAAASFAAWAGCFEATVDVTEPGSSIRRVCFGLPDPNEQAMVLLFALCFLLFWPFDARREGAARRCALAGTLVVLVGLLLTMSRTGWVGAVGLLLVRCATTGRRLAAVLSVALACAAAVVGGRYLVGGEHLEQRVAEAARADGPSIASRLVHYSEAGREARKRPILGHGLGATLRLEIPFRDPLGNRLACTVHSVPLIVWLDTGLVGLLAYGWLWACVASLLYLAWREASSLESRGGIMAYASVAGVYAGFSLVMPFMYRPSLAVLSGALVGYLASVQGVSPAKGAPDEDRPYAPVRKAPGEARA